MTEWQNIKLGDVCSITMGTSPKGEDINTLNGMPFFQGSAEFGNRYPTVAKFTLNPIRLAKKGDILFSVRAPVGDLNIANIDCCIGRGLCAIRAIDFSLQHFVEYALLLTKNKWSAINDSGSVFGCAKRNDLLNFEIPWTKDVVVLKQIAGILGALDDKIEVLREQNKTLEQMAQAVFQSWFVDFDIVRAKAAGMPIADICKKYRITPDICDLFPSAFTTDNLPLGWEKKKLGELVQNVKKPVKPSVETEQKPYVPIDCITAKSITLYDFKEGKEAQSSLISFEPRDILFGAMRAYFHKVCIAPFAGTTRSTVFCLRPKTSKDFSFVSMSVFQNRCIAYASQNSKGTTMPYAVWDNNLSEYQTEASAESVRVAFNECIGNFFDKMMANAKQIRTLEQTRDALLPQLLGGKIEV